MGENWSLIDSFYGTKQKRFEHSTFEYRIDVDEDSLNNEKQRLRLRLH